MNKNFTLGLIIGLICGLIISILLASIFLASPYGQGLLPSTEEESSSEFVSVDEIILEETIASNIIDSTALYEANNKYKEQMKALMAGNQSTSKSAFKNDLTTEVSIDMKSLLVAMGNDFPNLITVKESEINKNNFDLYLRVVPFLIDSSLELNKIAKRNKMDENVVEGRVSFGVQVFSGEERNVNGKNIFKANTRGEYYDFGKLCPPNCKPPKT